jgi:hypothetical protein
MDMNKRTLLTYLIISAKKSNFLLKISMNLLITFAAKTHLAEELAFAQWQTIS